MDLPLHGLNVLIGPNGSGKSNLIELIALLQACPRDLSRPFAETGGMQEWLWKGKPSVPMAHLEAVIADPLLETDLRHTLAFRSSNHFELAEERIAHASPLSGQATPSFYEYHHGQPRISDVLGTNGHQGGNGHALSVRDLNPTNVSPDRSILAQLKDPERYPFLTRLQGAYSEIRVYRNVVLGPASPLRRPQIASGPVDVVEEDFSNYQRVVWNLRKSALDPLLEHLALLYAGAEDFHLDAMGDTVLLSVREAGVGYVPATRLSDGTLRYLCLLAILLTPTPPPMIVIDEPDLGLHPDLMPTLANLLVSASERTQVLVTTHSRALVDAFSDQPEAVVVCERDATGTFFERLDGHKLTKWLDRYSLGQLWSRGDLGGNRW